MSTRSDIIVHCTDDKWRRIYCHWDGYLEHNGRILFDSYTDRVQATVLIMPGDLSSLHAKCSKPPRGHTFEKPKKGYCVYYGRDRGETETGPKVGDSLVEVWPPEETWTEFTYVFADRGDGSGFKWWVGDPDENSQTLRDLGDALLGKTSVRSHIKMFGGIILGKHGAVDPTLDCRGPADR
jgi:hypothetical protein